MTDAAPVRFEEPWSRAELIDAFRTVHAQVDAYWRSLEAATFAEPIGPKWSPGDNARHLTLTDRGVTRGFAAPREVLVARFGAPDQPSRPFPEIANRYIGLGAALQAPTQFQPAGPPGADRAAWRDAVLAEADEAAAAYLAALERWPDDALDQARMPHPLMGPLTMREFAGWNVHHHAHHARTVQRLLSTPRA